MDPWYGGTKLDIYESMYDGLNIWEGAGTYIDVFCVYVYVWRCIPAVCDKTVKEKAVRPLSV